MAAKKKDYAFVIDIKTTDLERIPVISKKRVADAKKSVSRYPLKK